jgi:hypothetical protein
MQVKRINGNIRIPKAAVPTGCADHLSLPEYYSDKGIPETDLVLVVTGIYLFFFPSSACPIIHFCFFLFFFFFFCLYF